MAYEIKHLSEEEIQAIKERYPQSNPKAWAVYGGNLLLDYMDTEQEAKEGQAQWERLDRIQETVDRWITEQAEEFGITESEFKSLVKDTL